ncbi:MAG: DUF5752 family protein [Gammaproteobacteria bacterium]
MQDTPPADTDSTFAVKDCALISIATGKRAYDLKELADTLQEIGLDSVYYHFWGGLLEPRFEEREYNNDFAAWARHGLHDNALAERLAVVDPTDYVNLEDLRQELVEVMEESLDTDPYLHWSRALRPFDFIRAQIVVFDTQGRVGQPGELLAAIPKMSTTSVFYHFIDAHRRPPERTDDFSAWLAGFGEVHRELCAELGAIDPYFGTLMELRARLTGIFSKYFG